ncbi:50S ribosomal protein L24 [bacterium]|nr:50S ribosomal protein L24 [bacterium]
MKRGSGELKPRAQQLTALKKGDMVMVIAGGNSKTKKLLKGERGKILRILPKNQRVIVEGLNMMKRHKRARNSQDSSSVVVKEGSIALSNVMFYSESLKRPVRLCSRVLNDGKKVRGYVNPTTKKFEQI